MNKAMVLFAQILLAGALSPLVSAQTTAVRQTAQPAAAATVQQQEIDALRAATAQNKRAIQRTRTELQKDRDANTKAIRASDDRLSKKIDASSKAAEDNTSRAMRTISDRIDRQTATFSKTIKFAGIAFGMTLLGVVLFFAKSITNSKKKMEECVDKAITKSTEAQALIEAEKHRAKILAPNPFVGVMRKHCKTLRDSEPENNVVYFDQVARSISGIELGTIHEVMAVFGSGPLDDQMPDIFFPGEITPVKYKNLARAAEKYYLAHAPENLPDDDPPAPNSNTARLRQIVEGVGNNDRAHTIA